ncbi:hypothetical protein CLV56_2831 [Mumia flava]|uniref:Preprotein translocase subunit SecB n=1 Tax=Mumia flava TaxID=1348852 RepID=A0A0B2BQT5_9ACTN|nr:hypothetical protein [Mumia flava]PJJ58579.1 hypothetical protein CLV56_2831 [Mumia flava]
MSERDLTIAEMREFAIRVRDATALRDVRLESMTCSSRQPILDVPMSVDTDVAVSVRRESDQALAARSRYNVVAKDEGDEEAWSASFVVLGEFHSVSDDPLPDWGGDAQASFGLLVSAMALHPFARELAQSLSARMGYPSFTLDLLPSLAEEPPDRVVTVTVEDDSEMLGEGNR